MSRRLRDDAAFSSVDNGEALTASRRMLRGEPKELLATMDAEGREFAKRLAMPEARAALLAFTSKKRQG